MLRYCTDNAAMIAAAAEFQEREKKSVVAFQTLATSSLRAILDPTNTGSR
jgi:tRNA A37 threonylcarbamoyltransferase TsaD